MATCCLCQHAVCAGETKGLVLEIRVLAGPGQEDFLQVRSADKQLHASMCSVLR